MATSSAPPSRSGSKLCRRLKSPRMRAFQLNPPTRPCLIAGYWQNGLGSLRKLTRVRRSQRALSNQNVE